jgi:predicted nucleic acid-binding protein
MRVLLDTNIILDVLLSREPQVHWANKIFELIYREKIEAAVTASSVTDIYYIAAKRIGDPRAREALRHLLNILGVISVNGEDCAAALDLPIADFEDALVSVCAEKDNIGYIISNDKEFLQVNPKLANVITAADYLRL